MKKVLPLSRLATRLKIWRKFKRNGNRIQRIKSGEKGKFTIAAARDIELGSAILRKLQGSALRDIQSLQHFLIVEEGA